MSNKPPAFQMYAADIYIDTNEWSAEAFGIYNRLLYHQWVNGSIPSDMRILAQVAFVSVKKMTKRWPEMVSKFVFDENNRGFNLKMESVRSKQCQYIEMQKKKALLRWGSAYAAASTAASTPAMPEDMPEGSSSISTPTFKEDIGINIPMPGGEKKDDCPQQEIIAAYHEILPAHPRVKIWRGKNPTALRARWREDKERQSVDWWRKFFRYIASSDYLMGRTSQGFNPDLQWIIMLGNFDKIANGRYHKGSVTFAKSQPGIEQWLKERAEK